jgi:hypothetical protein
MAAALTLSMGCAVRATELRNVTLARTWSASADQQTSAKVLVFPFDDARGATYSDAFAVPMLYHEWQYQYPESTYILKGSSSGMGRTALVGDLGTSLPYILAKQLRESRVANQVNVLHELPYNSNLQSYAFHIRGRILEWSCEDRMNVIPGVILGYIGVPFGVRTMRAKFEVDLIESKSGKVTATHAYKDERSEPFSLYYNLQSGQELALETLDTTISAMVKDLAKDM